MLQATAQPGRPGTPAGVSLKGEERGRLWNNGSAFRDRAGAWYKATRCGHNGTQNLPLQAGISVNSRMRQGHWARLGILSPTGLS